MPKVRVEKTTAMTGPDAFSKIKTFLDTDPDLRKIDSSYKCEFNEQNLTGTAKGKKFDAQLTVETKSPTKVAIEVDLPLLLSPIKGLVENQLRTKLDKLLG